MSCTNDETCCPEVICGCIEIDADLGYKGDTGDSAYEIAVRHGFEGDEAAWVASLKEPAETAAAAAEAKMTELEGEFDASQEQHQASFDQAQEHRASQFTAKMADFEHEVSLAVENAGSATDDATEAAEAALNAADNLAQRVQAGEFNGAPFRFSYSVPSVEALAGITGMKRFDLATITSDVEDPDNAKFFMWTGTEWHYEGDLSGSQGIQGPQGVQGVSLKNVQVIDTTKVEVTQYDPMTQQDRTYVIGDFAAPLAAGIKAYVDSKFVVVDDMPSEPVEGLLYFVRE